MANEPSLGELQSYTGRPELAAGERNVVQDNSQAINYLLQGARDKMQNQWNKYIFFQRNLAEGFKNAANFDYVGTRATDRDELQKTAADFYSIIQKDPSILANPMKNPQLYGEMLKKQSELNSKIAKSKEANAYTEAQQKFLFSNPDLSTDDNLGLIKQSNETPLDAWQPFNLNLPTGIDLLKLSSEAVKNSMIEKPVSEQVFQVKINPATGKPIPKIDPNTKQPMVDERGNVIFEQEYAGRTRVGTEKKSDFDIYLQRGKSLLESNPKIGKYGVPFSKGIEDLYRNLPNDQREVIEVEAKKQGKKPIELFFEKSWQSLYSPLTDLSGVKEQEDKVYQENVEARNRLLLEQEKGKQDRFTISFKESYGTGQNSVAAYGIINEVADILNKGTRRDIVDRSTGKRTELITISDPNLLKQFAQVNNDGTTQSAPTEIRYNPKTNQVNLVYLSEKSDPKDPTAIVEKVVPMDARTWVNGITQRTYTGKDRGGVNEIVQKVITENNGDLFGLAQKIKAARDKVQTSKTATNTEQKKSGTTGQKYVFENGKLVLKNQ